MTQEYCGMACDMLLEDQMEILKHCIKHAEYDAEFAPIMVQKLIDQAQKVKNDLIFENTESEYQKRVRKFGNPHPHPTT